MQKCFEYAISYLNRYPQTVLSMKKQLQKKWYEDEEIENTLHMLIEKRYLDDRNYAYLYLNSEVGRKWKPLFVIQQKLQQKWVQSSILEDIIEKYKDEFLLWIQEKLKKEIMRMGEKWMQTQKIIQRLQGRWYGYREIQAVIGDYRK